MAGEPKEVLGFKLGHVLGRGGFGFVKEAELNGKHYAMKVLTKGSSGWNSQEEEMVRAEIEIMAKLDHPRIIKVISHDMHGTYPRDGQNEECVIIVMELAEGGNLFDILFFTDGFSEDITRTYLGQLCDALKHMHDNKIAHRDIKPQNTLLDSDFNIKICDFGLSKQTDGASLMETRLGTIPFQAPEILMSRDYDYGVDVFALGVLFFLMLTGGVPPFKSASTEDKWFKCIAGKVPDKFWRRHKAAKKKIQNSCADFAVAAELFFWMCAYQPTERATIQDVAGHSWFNGPKKVGEDLVCVMKDVVNQAMTKKREDPELGGEVSKRVRAMCMAELDLTTTAPENAARFVPHFTYEINMAGHPYVLFKSIENFLVEAEVPDECIEFDPAEFSMTVQAEFAGGTKADFSVYVYREGGTDYVSFKKTNHLAYDTGTNMLISKIIERHCQQLGESKLLESDFQPATPSQINDVRAHMEKLKAARAEN